jgi:hypothetical protein
MQLIDQVEVLVKLIPLSGYLPWQLYRKMFPLASPEEHHIKTYFIFSLLTILSETHSFSSSQEDGQHSTTQPKAVSPGTS